MIRSLPRAAHGRVVWVVAALFPIHAKAAAPVFVNDAVSLWFFAIFAMPFAALLIPGEGKIGHFFGFALLAAVTAGVSIAVGFGVAKIPWVSDGFAQFCALLVVAAPYGLIALLCRERNGKVDHGSSASPPADQDASSSKRADTDA